MTNVHAAWVRWLMLILSLDQTKLGLVVGVDQSLISRWKTGKRTPLEHQWKALARLARVGEADYWKGPPIPKRWGNG